MSLRWLPAVGLVVALTAAGCARDDSELGEFCRAWRAGPSSATELLPAAPDEIDDVVGRYVAAATKGDDVGEFERHIDQWVQEECPAGT